MIQEHILLKDRTTMRVGGTARYFAEVTTLVELEAALAFANEHSLPKLILGGGSNLILPNDEYPGLVIAIETPTLHFDTDQHRVRAGAGVVMADLVRATTERGWAGLEWAGGLPGTLGGAIRGNAGAFGGEIKDSVLAVEAFDPVAHERKTIQTKDCRFAYRTSHFKASDLIIWEARLQFQPGDPVALSRIRDEKIEYRYTHHPHQPSAGSIFQNLKIADLPADFFTRFPDLHAKTRGEKLGAASLLEPLGMKRKRLGDAMVSAEHANIIVNLGSATADDIYQLTQQMKAAVRAHYGIDLHEEPQFVLIEEQTNS